MFNKIFVCLTIFLFLFIFYRIFYGLFYLNFEENNHLHQYLFVTSYFHIDNYGKHTLQDYKMWINNFFSLINNSLVIFTDNNISSLSFVPSFVKAYKYEYKSIWDVPCIKKYKKYYIKQHDIDREKYHHNPDIYAIWNCKICFLNIAANEINSKLYIWIDIGTFRDPTPFHSIPSLKAMDIFYKFNSMFFFIVYNQTFQLKNKTELVVRDWIEGTSFGGTKKSIHQYNKEFWKVHDYYMNNNQFIGKDQTLFNTLALYKINVTIIRVHGLNMCMANPWWKFQCFYAGMNLDLLQKNDINDYII